MLKTGDVLICTSDRFIPKVIKWATKSKWNHSALYVEVEGVPGVIEAQPDGINWKPFKAWEEKYGYHYMAYRNNISVPSSIKKKAFSKAGHTGYDFVSFLFRHPIELLTGKWRYRGEDKEDNSMICSEFVGWVYSMPEWWKMTPDDQKKYMSESFNWNLIN